MVELSDELIQKYQQMHKDLYGEDISKQEAYEQGSNLVGFFKLLMEWDQKEKQKNQQLHCSKEANNG